MHLHVHPISVTEYRLILRAFSVVIPLIQICRDVWLAARSQGICSDQIGTIESLDLHYSASISVVDIVEALIE